MTNYIPQLGELDEPMELPKKAEEDDDAFKNKAKRKKSMGRSTAAQSRQGSAGRADVRVGWAAAATLRGWPGSAV